MSGSPIIAENGTVIGIVCLGTGQPDDVLPTEGGPNPRLMGDLPIGIGTLSRRSARLVVMIGLTSDRLHVSPHLSAGARA